MPELTPLDDNRQEHFLNGEDLEPITRREHFYAGRENELPEGHQEPETREEWFIKKYREAGDVTVEEITITENGTTTAPSGKAYSPIHTNVPQPTLTTLDVTENGTYTAPSGTAYNKVDVDIEGYKITDVSGLPSSIATFSDGANLPMPKLEVAVEPIQDLHGYDAPWAGGAGKNKFPVATATSSGTQNIFTAQTVSLKANTNYVLSFNSATPTTNDMSLSFNNGNTQVRGITINAGVTSVNLTFSQNVDNIDWYVREAVNLSNIMIESGSSKTTFAPYSNICPISGWTEANVGVVGKNLFDKTATDTSKGFISGKWINQTGNTFLYRDWNVSEYIRVDGEKIAVSGMTVAEQVSSGRGGYCCYDKYKNVLGGGTYNALTQIITLPTNTEYIRISVWNANKDVCQLELSETATAYEPYNGHTYTIPFTDAQGNPITVYGGELDVVNGIIKPNIEYDSYNGETLVGRWISDRDVYAEGTSPTIGAQVVDFGAYDSDITTQPTAIKSLNGQNNLSANTGDVVEASYFESL